MSDMDDARTSGADHRDAAQEHVAGLLGAAAGSPTTPPEVAARLDDVLAGLVAERRGEEGPSGSLPAGPAGEGAGSTELDSRRRRWPSLLVAAAAVSVVGLGIGNLADGRMAGDQSAGQSAVTAEDAGAAAEREQSDSGGAPTADEDRRPVDESSDSGAVTSEGLAAGSADDTPRLRTGSLAVDVQRIADFPLERTPDKAVRGDCVAPEVRPGDAQLRVRLDGAPAVLVLRAPADGRRTADVFTCDDADTPAVSTTVDAR